MVFLKTWSTLRRYIIVGGGVVSIAAGLLYYLDATNESRFKRALVRFFWLYVFVLHSDFSIFIMLQSNVSFTVACINETPVISFLQFSNDFVQKTVIASIVNFEH